MVHEAVMSRVLSGTPHKAQHCSQQAAGLPQPIPYRDGTMGTQQRPWGEAPNLLLMLRFQSSGLGCSVVAC